MPDYAVFTELSPDSKPMVPGWNRRVFTDTDARKGDAIQCDFTTGIVTLAPGTYHITALSMVVYTTGTEPPETTTIRSPASAGYCRLRVFDPAAEVAGSGSLREMPNGDPHPLHRQPEYRQSHAEPARNLLRNRPDGADTSGASVGLEPGPDLSAGLRREFQMARLRPNQHPGTLT